MKWTKGQWPDNICSGYIDYSPHTLPVGIGDDGFILRDASHGIPVFGSVRGRVFNYPGQTEAIARRLVAAWNASVGISTEELEKRASKKLGETK